MKRSLVFIVVLFALCPVFAQVNDPVSPLRIAYLDDTDRTNYQLPDAFLQRAEHDGFNYVLAEFHYSPNDWDGAGNCNSNLQNKLKRAFMQVDSFNMSLLPEFQTGDCHTSSTTPKNGGFYWDLANRNIQWNATTWDTTRSMCPIYTADPAGQKGMDYCFNNLIQTVWKAYQSATIMHNTDSLRYINIGHDEPLIYGQWQNNNLPNFILVGQNHYDSLYLKNKSNGSTVQGRMQGLFANEIRRRVNTISTITGNRVKTMIYADMEDPSSNGGASSRVPCTTSTITTYHLLDSLKSVKTNLVLIPWAYDTLGCFFNGSNWINIGENVKATFTYFKGDSFSFVYADQIDTATDGWNDWQSRAEIQMSRWVCWAGDPSFRASSKTPGCLGFVSEGYGPWPGFWPFETMEYLSTYSINYYATFGAY